MEVPAHLTVDLGRLDGGKRAHLEGLLDQAILELDDMEQLHAAGPVTYCLDGEKLLDGEFLVRGRLSVRCDCVCSRCGGDFAADFGVADYCESFEIGGLETLDLTESVRESILLTLPFYPLCKEDCKGVCMRCSQDLNAGPCACEREGRESPWAALDALAPEA